MSKVVQSSKKLFEFALSTENEVNPLHFGLHYRMLKLYQNYHATAKRAPNFSLLATLGVFRRIVKTDPWLSRVVSVRYLGF
ncbi:MAG: hypothetical protein ACXAC7_16325 [Candidatus Hodarchaeales archaeon]|jgi:hypothetical protein